MTEGRDKGGHWVGSAIVSRGGELRGGEQEESFLSELSETGVSTTAQLNISIYILLK